MIGLLERMRSHYKAIKHSARVCKILLADHRYFASVRDGKYQDNEGHYVPWFTFPAIEAIKNWDLSDKRVFEYGSGYSTLFWAARAKEVTSVEHSPEWHAKVAALAPANARVILAPITQREDEYHPTIETRGQFK